MKFGPEEGVEMGGFTTTVYTYHVVSNAVKVDMPSICKGFGNLALKYNEGNPNVSEDTVKTDNKTRKTAMANIVEHQCMGEGLENVKCITKILKLPLCPISGQQLIGTRSI